MIADRSYKDIVDERSPDVQSHAEDIKRPLGPLIRDQSLSIAFLIVIFILIVIPFTSESSWRCGRGSAHTPSPAKSALFATSPYQLATSEEAPD